MAERYIESLIARGYTEIVIVGRSGLQEKDRAFGGWDRETIELVVKNSEGEYEHIRCIIYQEYGPFHRSETPTITEITPEQHAEALAVHTRYDTPDIVKQVAEKKRKKEAYQLKQAKAQKWINDNRPNCPKCGKPMKRCCGNVNFWGCRQHPRCNGKRWMRGKLREADFYGAT